MSDGHDPDDHGGVCHDCGNYSAVLSHLVDGGRSRYVCERCWTTWVIPDLDDCDDHGDES
jgi:hypothetical protein